MPKRETSFGRYLRGAFVGCLPFWYNNPSVPGQSSHSGTITSPASHYGILILPFWYLILPFWYFNDVQCVGDERVATFPTCFKYIKTLKTRVRAKEPIKEKMTKQYFT